MLKDLGGDLIGLLQVNGKAQARPGRRVDVPLAVYADRREVDSRVDLAVEAALRGGLLVVVALRYIRHHLHPPSSSPGRPPTSPLSQVPHDRVLAAPAARARVTRRSNPQ